MQDPTEQMTPLLSPGDFGGEPRSNVQQAAAAEIAATGGTLFPLPLTPFERYMLVDERPGYPMTFVFEFLWRGNIDSTQLESAAQVALQRHPLLSARIVKQGQRSYWKAGTARVPAIQWVTPAELKASVGVAIRPEVEPPCQLRASAVKDGLLLQTMTHHAASDGLGVVGFISDLMQEYDRHSSELTTAAQPPPDEARLTKLQGRGEFQIHLPAPVSRWTARRFLMREAVRFLCRRTCRLRATPAAAGTAARPLLVLRLPPRLHDALGDSAQARGASINTLVLAALLQTVSGRQFVSQPGRPRKWIRVAVPINLRGRKDRQMPAANMIGYAFLDRQAADCHEARHLVEGIAAEIAAVRRWSLATCFVDGLRLLDRFPGALHLMTRLAANSATIVYSNLGDVGRTIRRPASAAGDQPPLLQLAAAAPPVRPGTGVGLGLMRVGEESCFALTYDPRRFSAAASGQLLRQLVACLAQLLEAEFDPLSLELADGLAEAVG